MPAKHAGSFENTRLDGHFAYAIYFMMQTPHLSSHALSFKQSKRYVQYVRRRNLGVDTCETNTQQFCGINRTLSITRPSNKQGGKRANKGYKEPCQCTERNKNLETITRIFTAEKENNTSSRVIHLREPSCDRVS
jgi:hypothetical protein